MPARIAILDPFSGIAGDMTLGALVAVGLDADWLRALPAALGLSGVRVRIQEVLRGEIACWKVDFDIPPQPHGRGIREIRRLVEGAGVPESVREKADRTFRLIAEQEGSIHGVAPDEVHLHEVGAVDAILDVVGSIWGLELLGVERVFCGALQVGDGFVRAAHGMLPVPAPATMRLLEGLAIRPGPEGAGELVTPTGAALVRTLSEGRPPAEYVPRVSGFGAGTKDFVGRANALRIILADLPQPERGTRETGTRESGTRESLVQLVADLDDVTGESIADAADALRAAGALDVVVVATVMKKGRPGTRLEVLACSADADALESLMLQRTPTIGVRRWDVTRRALAREERVVDVRGQRVRVKVVTTPDGTSRAKPEHEDVRAAAVALGTASEHVARLALDALSEAKSL
jgi:uncharacterized protein (TIGR00299 family) protein